MKMIESLAYTPTELSFGTSGLRTLVVDMTDLECYINTLGFLRFLADEERLRTGEAVYIAGDLRPSTPRIMAAVLAAVTAGGYLPVNCGKIPTPAVAYYAMQRHAPSIMVTGSHIPADRNGIKFNKRIGEVLKADEPAIQQAVAVVRRQVYDQAAVDSAFDSYGHLKAPPQLGPPLEEAEAQYVQRYLKVFPAASLSGKQLIVYQQSAVGRDILVALLQALGAEVIAIERSAVFIPIDTENITERERQRFKGFSRRYPQAFAIISADGDSDRPIVIDETGEFHRGDLVGCLTARYLGARFAAVPISSNDAVDQFCKANGMQLVHTKVGSPYVIAGMQAAAANQQPTVSWEVNGGFLTGSDISLQGRLITALPTRDAVLPIICTLLSAVERQLSVSAVFAGLPQRFTGGGLIDDVALELIQQFREQVSNVQFMQVNVQFMQVIATGVFRRSDLGEIAHVDTTDGLRLIFETGDIIHIRPSGNAPQFRVYSNASSSARAKQLAAEAVAPNGYITRLLETLTRSAVRGPTNDRAR